jgi:Uma2 family endonuclease
MGRRNAELLLPVEEYLIAERRSEVRHEYLGGAVYPIAESSEEHNVLIGSLGTLLHSHLRGRRCRTFMLEMKVRLRLVGDEVLYYPDLMVACDPRDTDRYFKRYPSVLIEVLSPDTERTDRQEKRFSYLGIETLEAYILVAQDRMEVTVFRKSADWQPEILRAPTDLLRLPHLDFEVALSAIYEGLSHRPDGTFRVAPL